MIIKQAIVTFLYSCKSTEKKKRMKCVMMVEFMHDASDSDHALTVTKKQRKQLTDELLCSGYEKAKIKKISIVHTMHQKMRITSIREVARCELEETPTKKKKGK